MMDPYFLVFNLAINSFWTCYWGVAVFSLQLRCTLPNSEDCAFLSFLLNILLFLTHTTHVQSSVKKSHFLRLNK